VKFLGLAEWLAGFVLLYAPVLAKLARDWAADANYSHGFLVVPLAAYLAWESRTTIYSAPVRPSRWGFVAVLASLGVLLVGSLGAELFLTRLSMIGVVAGTVVFSFGWAVLRAVAFPIAFLLLMIPPPAIVFNAIALPLQLWASHVGETMLRVSNVPVFREGNVLVLPNVTLQVSEACSGIRSLVSLGTAAIVFAHMVEPRRPRRVLLVMSSVPIAILVNAVRVAATGIAAASYGPEAASGILHATSGWLMFIAALGLLWAFHRTLVRFAPVPRGASLAGAPA
jgi:exosortase